LGEREIEAFIGSWNLIPGVGGVFELTVNGDLLYSKKALGRHAEEGEVRKLIVQKLAELRPA
jgi:selenoprotein W-related protein